ncbi:hypothetical protein Hanom_Chr12g01103441 [Helianthus anomalus]
MPHSAPSESRTCISQEKCKPTIFFFLFLNFNTVFQIITLEPFKFNFQSHTFFWEKGHKILLCLRPPKWLSRP